MSNKPEKKEDLNLFKMVQIANQIIKRNWVLRN
jgi:hypothetical protein